jgi:hypothetical protein
MSFVHGKSALVLVNGYDLSAYLKSCSIKQAAAVSEDTGFGSSAKTYLPGLKEGSISAEGYFNGSAGATDPVLKTALGNATASIWLVFPGGAAVGSYGYGQRAINSTYEVTPVVEDVVSCSAEAQRSDTIDRVVSLHALSAETAGGDGTILDDNGAASTDGAVAYLFVTDFDGTDITVKVQDSSSPTFASDVNDLITFTAVTADNTYERKTAAGAVDRYMRITWSGTFTTATPCVGFSRK